MNQRRTKTVAEGAAQTAAAADVNAAETNAAPSERDVLWQRYCRLALNQHHANTAAEFETVLQAGALPRIAEPSLMAAALRLVAGMAAAGVRRWDFLPAPTAEDLADPADWIARRLAEQRATQDAAQRIRHLDQQAARALGQAAPGTGTIRPVHEQQSPYDLAELGRRLESTMAKHRAERAEFKREWLDHRSPFYIPVEEGGISNKQVAIMARQITGSASRRPFAENWKIVTDWLHERGANPTEEA